MPSIQARLEAQGRLRRSHRNICSVNKGSIDVRCTSLNSFCRLFIAEVRQLTRSRRKHLS
jgi:hypothetical protein